MGEVLVSIRQHSEEMLSKMPSKHIEINLLGMVIRVLANLLRDGLKSISL